MRNVKHIDFLKVTSVINSCSIPSHTAVASSMIAAFATKYGLQENHIMIRQLNDLLVFKTTPSPFFQNGKSSLSYFMQSPDKNIEQETTAWHLKES